MYAYILISIKEGAEKEILSKLMEEKEVEEGHVIFGEWDLIIKIKTESPEKAATFIMEKIRTMPEIKLTSTLIVAK